LPLQAGSGIYRATDLAAVHDPQAAIAVDALSDFFFSSLGGFLRPFRVGNQRPAEGDQISLATG
jgi:hypothetical protein